VTSKGINAFHDIRVSSFSNREGLGNVEVDTVLATRDGTVWAGGLGALDAIRADGTSIFRIGNGLPGHQITSLFEDHAGFLWIGVDRGIFIYRNGRFAPVSEPDGSPVGLVVGIMEDPEHNIWIEISGTPRKLIRIRDLKVRDEFPDTALPAARKIEADLRDRPLPMECPPTASPT
jgi:ligand-binding sensor domain-containing protein